MEVHSDDGVIPGREPFRVSAAPQPLSAVAHSASPPVHSMHLSFASDGTTAYKPITSPTSYSVVAGTVLSSGVSSGVSSGDDLPAAALLPRHGLNVLVGQPMKRRRGRPKKYRPDGTMTVRSPAASPLGSVTPTSGVFSLVSSGPIGAGIVTESGKKKIRPPAFSKKHQPGELGPAGFGFTPHVITVNTGEDVSSKIMSFSQNGARAVCVLSAIGSVSNVTLRQPATSGGTVTYEGRFEILSLSGSYLLTESGGQRSRTGGLSVSLAGSDGRVLGGGVAGLLTAASPVQVVVGSFIAEGRKEHVHAAPLESDSGPGLLAGGLAGGGSSSPSRGTQSESSGGPGSPPNQSNSSFHRLSGMPSWKQ